MELVGQRGGTTIKGGYFVAFRDEQNYNQLT